MPSFCHPSKIIIPSDRFRNLSIDDPRVIDRANSIEDIGQLQAILVSDDMVLRDGLCRLRACERLKRDVFYVTESQAKLTLDNPLLIRVAEYQANFSRSDFTPMETASAIAEIDSLMKCIYKGKKSDNAVGETWTQVDTAKKLGYKSHRTISDAIAIDKAVKSGEVPEIEKAKTIQEATKMVKNYKQLAVMEELAKRRTKVDGEIENPVEYFSKKVILGDCIQRMKNLSQGICNMFITDPPFGIKLGQILSDRGEIVSKTRGVYSDGEHEILSLIDELVPEIGRVGKPDCHVIMFCGVQFWHIIKDMFEKHGFTVHKKPLIWVKAKTCPFHLTTGRTNNPARTPGSSYEAMLYAWRGNPTLAKQGLSDVFIHQTLPSTEKCHVAQKPIDLMEEIIGRFYHLNTNPLLIDPFAGSGATLIAAHKLGLRQYFGYELDTKNRERAIANMVNWYVKQQKREDANLDEFE